MSTLGVVCQILAVLFVALHLFVHPEDWKRYLVGFAAMIAVFAIATALANDTARAVVLIGGILSVGLALRLYDARRPNRSRTRR